MKRASGNKAWMSGRVCSRYRGSTSASSSTLNESRQKTDQTVVADTSKRSQQRTGQEVSRIFPILAEQRHRLGRVSDGGSPRRSRDARLNSQSDRQREGEGSARSQAREGGQEAEKEEEETGE